MLNRKKNKSLRIAPNARLNEVLTNFCLVARNELSGKVIRECLEYKVYIFHFSCILGKALDKTAIF